MMVLIFVAVVLVLVLDVEAVVLAMPTGDRAGMAIDAFAKGKHVLVEKPIAMNAAAVEAMIAERGDRISGCCSSRHRLQPGARAAMDFIATGALGDLRMVRARGLRPARQAPEKTPPTFMAVTHDDKEVRPNP